ncbi:hypothetical protein CEQ90_20220 [Lewinellaceae bacterium SD302]|nr:hypothetical protein CEQ90_20220 [Lewinellaceae bacterium SD302]
MKIVTVLVITLLLSSCLIKKDIEPCGNLLEYIKSLNIKNTKYVLTSNNADFIKIDRYWKCFKMYRVDQLFEIIGPGYKRVDALDNDINRYIYSYNAGCDGSTCKQVTFYSKDGQIFDVKFLQTSSF